MTAATVQRHTHVTYVGNAGAIAVGALAGTTVAHGFIPDGWTGTQCMVCFGWSNDYRHTHRLWVPR